MVLVIAGERSGVGKTTVTLALLAALKRQGLTVQSFKVGPDYIDPMFHQYITGRPCRNLDPVLTSEEYAIECFSRHVRDVDCALVEGVMGLFDGTISPVDGKVNDFASTAHIARLLDLPVVLVIDCSRLSGSVAAIAHGYRTFDPRINFGGVVLNRVGSDRHLELLQNALEPLQLPILGILRRQDNITIPDRHLGLVPAGELANLDKLIDKIAQIGCEGFDWKRLLPLLEVAARKTSVSLGKEEAKGGVKIAIALDAAFNFYYQDNLDILESLGAELVFWSPLADTNLPEKVKGLYFGGGFPEVFAKELSENFQARAVVKAAIASGMPTYAECGGLMYLCDRIVDFEGRSQPMVGIIPSTAIMDKRLTLGYRQATALQNSPLVAKGETVWGHEFHRSRLHPESPEPLFQVRGFSPHSQSTGEGWRSHFNLHASYIHLHWGARREIPARFLQHCANFCTQPSLPRSAQ